MNALLKKFWKWFDITPEEYAACDIEYVDGHMEFDYPHFDDLEKYAFKIVDDDVNEYEEIYDLITIMALDNEAENVLDYIEEHSSNTQIERIVEIGVSHLQPQARWQLAELIIRRRPQNFTNNLIVLSHDIHPYVRKRAQNCLYLLKR